MARREKQKGYGTTNNNFDVMKEVMANRRKNEQEKQKEIYKLMNEVQIERKR